MGTLLAAECDVSDGCCARQVDTLTQQVQEVTGEAVEALYADASYLGEDTALAARHHGIHLVIVKRLEASSGFVLLPQRWVALQAQSFLIRSTTLFHWWPQRLHKRHMPRRN